MRSTVRLGLVLCLAFAFNSTFAAEPRKTGDDDDIDDLIVERENAADRARANENGGGLNETEDDLYVGAAPTPQNAPTDGGTLIPPSGNWGEFVTVNGAGYGGADGVQFRWYPNDDDSQPAAMRQTATIRGRTGADDLQIQMAANPANSGWSGDFTSGVVRVYVYLPGQLEPVLAGHYTVSTGDNRAALRAAVGINLTKAGQAGGTTQAPPDAAPPQISATERPTGGFGNIGGVGTAATDPAPTATTPTAPGATTPPSAPPSTERFAGTLGAETGDLELAVADAGQPAPVIVSLRPVSLREFRVKVNQTGELASPEHSTDPAWIPSTWEINAMRVGTNQPIALTPLQINWFRDNTDQYYRVVDTWHYDTTLGYLVPGLDYDVWATTVFKDGSRKASAVERVRMPDPVNPTGFTATTDGPGTAKLSWAGMDGASHYFVEGSNLAWVQVGETMLTVADLEPGDHEWRLIAAYGEEGIYNDRNPSIAKLTIAAGAGAGSGAGASTGAGAATTGSSGKYRLSVVGFTANRATYDNPLQLDGKGDEVFLSASVQIVDTAGNTTTGGLDASLRSNIYGDTAFQQGRRVAGSLSGDGGIQNGDSYPVAPWAGTPDPSDPLAIPMALWSGTLTDGGNAVIVTPTLWEYDGSGYANAFQNWVSWSGRAMQTLSGSQLVEMAGWESPVQLNFGELGAGLAIDFQESIIGTDGDRPIGMQLQNGRGVFVPKSIVLTKSAAESVLANQIGSLPQGVYPVQYQDDAKWWGDYTLYIKVERMQ